MKYSLLLFSFLLLACTEAGDTNKSLQEVPDTAEKLPDYGMNNTPIPIIPLRELPESFVLDSIFYEDEKFNFGAFILYPKSIADAVFNERVDQFIREHMNMEKPDNNSEERTTFGMWITEIYVSDELIRFTFAEQSFTEGSGHYNNWSGIMNYNPWDRTYESLITGIDLR